MDRLTKQEKRSLIDSAWSEYRAASTNLPRAIGWSDYLDADARLWGRYLSTERAIQSAPEASAA